MFTVSPSIYSADLLHLQDVLDASAEFEHIHLDIDDGNFVKGISFGMDLAEQIAAHTEVSLDAHLEVLRPLDYVDPLAEAGVGLISAHLEILDYPSLFLSKVHCLGKKAGLALNLKTPVSMIGPFIDQIDQLLLMSAETDHDGVIFRKSVLQKIKEARKLLGEDVPVWVDGGISEENLKDVVLSGADGVVVGRAIYRADDFRQAYRRFLEAGRAYEKERREG